MDKSSNMAPTAFATSLSKSGSKVKISAALLAVGMTAALSAHAADWSDTSIGFRTGTKFAEPFGSNDIKKNIYSLTHVSGYKYGSNFFNVDMLQSDSKDPSTLGGTTGAQEAYVVYRNTFDIGKIQGSDIKFGPVRGVGATVGFDWNTKNDFGYGSKKRMLVVGPTLMVDVPGFLNVSLLVLQESNAPGGLSRYTYKTHPMLTAAWGIPLGFAPLSFEGFFNYIAAKGTNEFGGGTAPETNFDAELMYDLGAGLGGPKGTFKVGVEYQYWKNKFGNPTTDAGAGAGPGATAKTPMIRAEYHF